MVRGLFPLLQLNLRIFNREATTTSWQRAPFVVLCLKKATGSSPPLEGIGSKIKGGVQGVVSGKLPNRGARSLDVSKGMKAAPDASGTSAFVWYKKNN
jgi:hypothetical protein